MSVSSFLDVLEAKILTSDIYIFLLPEQCPVGFRRAHVRLTVYSYETNKNTKYDVHGMVLWGNRSPERADGLLTMCWECFLKEHTFRNM